MNDAAAHTGSRDALVADCAQALVDAFADYNAEFRAITRRARQRFEDRDWRGSQSDAVERIELYNSYVNRAVAQMRHRLGEDVRERAIWSSIKRRFTELIDPLPDREFDKTFFNSVTRRTFGTVGVDAAVEFVALDLDPMASVHSHVETKLYVNRGSPELLFEELLADFRFRTPYLDFDRSVRSITNEVKASLELEGERRSIETLEVIKEVFYQMTRAYLVGRIAGRGWSLPFVLALKNTESGVLIDAVMMDESTVSILFSFTRSYFHVDLAHVGEAVVFLKNILPRKPVSELYTVLGRAKQGKTERYRELFRHLQQSDDRFVQAPGEKGLVMVCFTLPSFDVVFKVIRDRFPVPKNILREEVLGKYELVFKHDRAGRLVDAQEFKRLKFPKERFAPEPLLELLTATAGTVHDEGEDLVIDHVYIERRMTPLNLYIRTATRDDAERAVLDYGQCDPRPRGDQHLRRRPAAQELRRHAPRPRDLLRLRRAVPGHRLPLPRHSAGAARRGRDARRGLVPRQRQRRVPGDVHAVPRLRSAPEGSVPRVARRDPDRRLVARDPAAAARRRGAGGAALSPPPRPGLQQPLNSARS